MDITNIEHIRNILGEPSPRTTGKIYDHLNARMVNFIRHSPLVMVTTVDSEGFPSISPKGDDPGFVHVEDAGHLLIPERKGNKLAFSFQNILEGSKVGLLFMVPGTTEVLRVHGTPTLVHDDKLNQKLMSKSQQALLVTRLAVANAYFHCGKALIRSGIWNPETPRPQVKVSFGQEIAENRSLSSSEADAIDEGVEERYRTDI
ncbi:MSMEG_1061 family FMN-dependent PPOX-type flavoprotein [Marinobacter lacisalsi]|uniref:MSMEG_1061 family FMN-dependent PPOX-type flavoprotein n=1 Tax=Marinobacter lacisalsi TaxID=475979 RepID=A0ABV8QD59_9GAMM